LKKASNLAYKRLFEFDILGYGESKLNGLNQLFYADILYIYYLK